MNRTIAMLALPGVQMLDVCGPLDVFAQANTAVGRDYYAFQVVASHRGPIHSSSGVRMLPDATVHALLPRVDTLLVAGTPHAADGHFNPAVLQWISDTARRCRRYGSICTGAFALAAAGLLDGRRVTTHWNAAAALRAAYPRVTVDEDALYLRDRKLRTAAGVTAGLDLALALVEEDLGREVAAAVAAQLVMYFKRPGGQLQFSRSGQAGLAGRSALQDVQRWAAAHPERNLSVQALAAHAGLSPRHFARLFHAEVGTPPAAWVEAMRVAAARTLLEQGHTPPKEVAARCGFASADTLRRAFQRRVGVSPALYRRHQAAGGE